jgi:hypothetical protein
MTTITTTREFNTHLERFVMITRHRRNGVIHREDGPAETWDDGSEFYLTNGKYDRKGGLPAKNYADGTKEYYENGERHRDGAPAVEYADKKSYQWYRRGKLHRDENDPSSCTYHNRMCTLQWHQVGQLNRLDGPAYCEFGYDD